MIAVSVPPLRDRRDDIPILVQHFLEKVARATNRTPVPTLPPEVMAQLMAYDWPGNVRELENAIERAVVLTRDAAVRSADLPEAVRRVADDAAPPPPTVIHFEVGQSLEALEREAIRRTLDVVEGNREAAASVLGISLATLYRRLREMGDDNEEDGELEGPGLFDRR